MIFHSDCLGEEINYLQVPLSSNYQTTTHPKSLTPNQQTTSQVLWPRCNNLIGLKGWDLDRKKKMTGLINPAIDSKTENPESKR